MKQGAPGPGEVDYLRACLSEHAAAAARGVVVEVACSPSIVQVSRMGELVLSNVAVGGPERWEDIDLDEAVPDMADLAAVAGSVDILSVVSGVPSAPGSSTLVVAGPNGDLGLL